MPTLPAEMYYGEIEASAARLAALVDGSDPDLRIPTCPDWTLRQLATHVGRAHRWAAEIVGTRSATMIEFRSVPDGKLPDGQAARGRWLTDGASRLVRALRDAGDAEVWVFHGLAPAGFWARRMAHETLVHRADAELAAGDEPAIAPGLAADAIDEWLTVVTAPADGAADPRARALPPGRILHVHATDHGLGEAGEWLISHAAEGVTVRPGHGKGDAALSGPAADLLLVLLGRKPSGRTAAQVFGDSALLDQWLAQTPF